MVRFCPSGRFLRFASVVVLLAGMDVGEHAAGSGHRRCAVVDDSAPAWWGRVCGGGLVAIGDRCLEERGRGVVGSGLLAQVVVGEVGVVVDFAVGVFGGLLGVVGGHPFLGGGLLGGVAHPDPPDPELDFRAVGFVSGAGGGGEPHAAGGVFDFQVADPLGQGVCLGVGFRGFVAQRGGFVGVRGGGGAVGPDGRVGAVLLGLVVGGFELVGDVARRPGLFPFVDLDPQKQPPVGKALFFGAGVGEGTRQKVEPFPAYAAVALAGLGDLPDTILTRSVVIRMRRRAPGEHVDPFRHRVHAEEGHQLREALAEWTTNVAGQLEGAWPTMPPGICDRPADVWEPLLAIADAAGGRWPIRAGAACVELVKAAQSADSGSLGLRLLADLRVVFDTTDRMGTETVLQRLRELDESPWEDLRGKPLDSRGLALPAAALWRHLHEGEDLRCLGAGLPPGGPPRRLAALPASSPCRRSGTCGTAGTTRVRGH
jgi:hypothetical protein